MTGGRFQLERLAREKAERERLATAVATIYISWSDTDLSFDFHCKCGAHFHCKCGARPCGGGTYCTYLKCPKCDRIYEMPLALEVKEIQGQPPYGIKPSLMEGE